MKYAVDAGTEIHLKAGLSAVIEATASITLQVGESVININPAGVFIDGPIVLIKSGALAVPGTGSNPDGTSSAQGANRAVDHNNPNTEDIEYDGTVGGDNARHPLETEAPPPAIEGDDAIDFEVKDNKEEPAEAGMTPLAAMPLLGLLAGGTGAPQMCMKGGAKKGKPFIKGAV